MQWLLLIFQLFLGQISLKGIKSYSSINFESRIVNGAPIYINNAPYQASIRVGASMRHNCGGSIITEWLVVTAAHCMYDRDNNERPPSDYTVVVGSTFLSQSDNYTQKIRVNRTVPHCNYESGDKFAKNDVGLLYLRDKIKMNPHVEPIALNTDDLSKGTPCVISGWGTLKLGGDTPDQLHMGEVTVDSFRNCKRLLGFVQKTLICAGRGSDVCHGDSGGPLQCEGRLAGIVSRGGCGHLRLAFYTRVSSYINFIQNEECAATKSKPKLWLQVIIFIIFICTL